MEIFDLYTENREKTGKTAVRGTKLDKGYHRIIVVVCIFNSKGQLLVQQRQATKKDWPNLWDVSAVGGAIAGDTSKKAAEREVYEELGIELVLDGCHALTFNENDVFCDYYVINKDIELSDIKLQSEEVQAVKWASKGEIITMIEEKIFIPYRRPVIDLLFQLKDRFGDIESNN